MVNIRVREFESSRTPIVIFPDIEWNNNEGYADLSIKNGDLKHENTIWTAVTIQLFTNLRAEIADNFQEKDPQGWMGDSFDLQDGDAPIGSHLWTLFQSALTDENIRKFEQYANIALDVLVDTGLISSYTVLVEANKSTGCIKLDIDVFANYTKQKYNKRFEILWSQIYGN